MKETALVTGGASGLGRALVMLLRDRKWDVAILDRDAQRGAQAAAETGAAFFPCDVGDRSSWKAALAQVEEALPPLKKVFLNAGIMSRPPDATLFDDISSWLEDGAYERVMRVNVEGVLHGATLCAPRLAAAGGGSITVTASVAGLDGFSLDPLYAMSKHAVVGLVRSFGPVFGKQGLRLAAFCPGGIETPLVPHELAGSGFAMMTPAEAAAACFEVSERAAPGEIWVRADAEDTVHPYRTELAFR